jgi:hypothetical protein
MTIEIRGANKEKSSKREDKAESGKRHCRRG